MTRLVVVFGLAVLMAEPCRACSVPVFRYALENWKASPFVVTIYHSEPLSDEQGERALPLEQGNANVTIKLVEGAVGPAEGQKLPWVMVQRPEAEEGAVPLWSGPLEKLDAQALCHSPARQEVVRQLTTGATAVWVLLESGDPKADRTTEMLLRDELAKLEKSLELPPPERTGPDLRSAVPLKVAFHVVKVRRDDPAEKMFVRQLLTVDEELGTVKGPILFPVYGRGRALGGLYGEGISKKEIASAGNFLCQECSCTVKALSPGADLLLDADWETLLELMEKPEAPERPPLTAPTVPPGIKPSQPAAEKQDPVSEALPLWPWLVAGALMVALVGALFVLQGGSAREGEEG